MTFSKAAGLAAVVLLATLSAFTYIYFTDNRVGVAQNNVKPYVQLQKVHYKEYPTEIITLGTIEESRPVYLISEVAGNVDEGDVPLREGQQFKKGRLLLEISHNEKKVAAYRQKKEFLDSLARMIFRFKRDTIDTIGRWRSYYYLVNLEKPVPDIIEPKKPQEQKYIDSSRIFSLYKEIKETDEELAKYVFYAPYKGNFDKIYVKKGEAAKPGDTLAQIINNDSLLLRAEVHVREVPFLYPDAEVDLYKEGIPTEFAGQIIRIGNRSSIKDTTVSIFISVLTDTLPVAKGMQFKVVIPEKSIENAMEVPQQALFDSNFVYIYKNGIILKKLVEIQKIKHSTALISGLPEGVMVAINPPEFAREGMEVEAEMPK